MKRSRSYIDFKDPMGSLSGASQPSLLGQQSRGGAHTASMSLPQTSLSLASSEACASPDQQRGGGGGGGGGGGVGEQTKESPSESASSGDTWPTEQTGEVHKKVARQTHERKDNDSMRDERERPDLTVVHRLGNSGRIRLRDVACEPINVVAQRMRDQPDELLEELKLELRDILGGAGGPQQREEFALVQKLLINRPDLTPDLLMRAHRVQLEILVAIKTGIQAFLHPDFSVTQSVLIEIFVHKRCRNMACQSQLPGEDCTCEVCNTKNGFCNACMCTICSKFDFDVNTCRWIGCDFCSHWTHTDCAIRVGQISMGPSLKGVGGTAEMLFRCKACKRASELLGWVKDVFRSCAVDWEREELMKEFDSVRRIFHGSEDSKGKRLFWKSEELLERLKSGAEVSTVCKEMQRFFQELEAEEPKDFGGDEVKIIEPQEACSRIAEVVQEAVAKMEAVAEEKARALKRARLALDACDRELEEKRKDLAELQFERQQKKQQIDELDTIVRLKQAEAEMFQMRADEARREAENIQRVVAAKNEKVEEEYTSRYLKLRLNEVEADRRALFEKIQLQEHSRLQPDPSQMLMTCKIQDLLKRVYSRNDLPGQNESSGPP
eukprot:c22670_g1_i1 orf=293-2119(-)